jgi:hypothetical protein
LLFFSSQRSKSQRNLCRSLVTQFLGKFVGTFSICSLHWVGFDSPSRKSSADSGFALAAEYDRSSALFAVAGICISNPAKEKAHRCMRRAFRSISMTLLLLIYSYYEVCFLCFFLAFINN